MVDLKCESNFHNELKMVLDYYVRKNYKLEGKFGDKIIKVFIDEKILFTLERLPGADINYGITFTHKSEESFLMELLGIPGIVDVYRR